MKKLIKQYVGTGIKLPAEQVTKLPNWAKKTYFRQRIISVGAEERLFDERSAYKDFVYSNLSTKEEIINAIKAEYNNWGIKYVYKNISDEWKIKYINLVISNSQEFNYDLYSISSDNVKKYYNDRVISEGLPVGGMYFLDVFTTPEDKDLYFNSLIINKRHGDNKWFEGGMMSDETAVKFADMVIDQINKKGRFLSGKFIDKYYEITGNSLVRVDKKYQKVKN